jgi:hypothetical protein
LIPLEYATPQPPKRGKYFGPLLRFGGGLAFGLGVTIIISKLVLHEGDDDPCCTLIGLPTTIFMCCGILRAAVWVRERAFGLILIERKPLLTLTSGVAMFAILFGTGFLFDQFVGPPHDGWVVLAGVFGLPAACAWVVFRPTQGGV